MFWDFLISLIFDSVNTFDRSYNTGWLIFDTFQGYPHMAELIKIAYPFK